MFAYDSKDKLITAVKYTPDKPSFNLARHKKKYKIFREIYGTDRSLTIEYKAMDKDWLMYLEAINNMAIKIDGFPEARRRVIIRRLLNMLSLATLNMLEEDLDKYRHKILVKRAKYKGRKK